MRSWDISTASVAPVTLASFSVTLQRSPPSLSILTSLPGSTFTVPLESTLPSLSVHEYSYSKVAGASLAPSPRTSLEMYTTPLYGR